VGFFVGRKGKEVNTLRPEDKAELEAMGIKVSLGTQEEAEAIGTLIYFVPEQRPSKADTPENKKPENEFPEQDE
jgi:hypothetical protein